MTTWVHVLRTFRRLGLMAVAGGLPLGAVLVAAPRASAAAATAVDCSTSNLQSAIDNAAPGATLAVTGSCFGNFTIGRSLTLLGQGTAVLDGQHAGTALTVSPGSTVVLRALTVTDGNATDGGGINNSGTLTLDHGTVSNSAAGSYGGGIYNNYNGALTLNQSTVSGNSSSVFGGGIYNNNAMTVQGSRVSGNSSYYGGGGIFTGFGYSPVTITDTAISDNNATAGSGAGIFNILDYATVKDSTISGNTAAYEGGGIDNNAGDTTLNDSTVTENSAQMGGGGIYDFSGSVPLNDSKVSGNNPDNCDPAGYVTGCTG